MISLSASSPTLISDLNHTFSAGLTSLISPGDLFTVEDIQASNDMEIALTAGTINVIDGNNIKLNTIKNVGMGDVSSGYGLMEELSVSDECLTVSSTTVTITGSLNLSGNTFNSIGPFNQTGESLFTGNLCVGGGIISATTIVVSGGLEMSAPIISPTSAVTTSQVLIRNTVDGTTECTEADTFFNKANQSGIEQITGPIITPPILAGSTGTVDYKGDNYEPTGFSTTNMIRQDITVNRQVISGMVAPPFPIARIVRICNLHATNDIRFTNQSSNSDEGNRFQLRDGAQKDLKGGETAAFWYDHTSEMWRPYNRIG